MGGMNSMNGVGSMSDILIREAEESDLPMIEKLVVELIESMENKEGIELHTVLENCQNLLKDINSHILVAELDGDVVGFINFTVRRTLLHIAPSGLIDELVVTENYRNKGIGKQLINAAIEKCRSIGCCEVEVSTESANTVAIEFYKKCGFEKKGVFLEKDLV
jgi:GNAT superfamily N-acetyltransferase